MSVCSSPASGRRPGSDGASAPIEVRGKLTIRTALLVGFGLTLAIWLFAGYYFTRRIDEVEGRAGAINARYMRAQELLSTVRAQVLLGSVYVRDALLDPDPAMAASYRVRLEENYRAVDEALRQYVPVLDSSAEQERVARLRHEIDDFRSTMLQVLETDSSRWPTEARSLAPHSDRAKARGGHSRLRGGAGTEPRRVCAAASGVADDLRCQHGVLWESLGLALAASFGIGLLATLYAGRLERRVREQRRRDVQNARELQRLSAS